MQFTYVNTFIKNIIEVYMKTGDRVFYPLFCVELAINHLEQALQSS